MRESNAGRETRRIKNLLAGVFGGMEQDSAEGKVLGEMLNSKESRC